MSNNNTIEYTIGWICALPLELVAAEAMLDCRHVDESSGEYTLGRIGVHNVVIACLPAGLTGTNAAATVAARMMSKFTSIRFGLMVGIGGGVPSNEFDIRLGDVVVSQPRNGYGGVVQYDFGKSRPGQFQLTGFLNTPPIVLLNALSKLQAYHLAGQSRLLEYLSNAAYQLRFALNTIKTDVLFEASYDHVRGSTSATAAAYAKEILVAMPGIEVSRTQFIDHVTKTEMLRADIETAIEALDLQRFLSMLPPVDQEKYTLDTPPLDRETPNYYWIFRNEDFRNWDTADSSRILWLAGPPECELRKAASSIIHLEMTRASTTPRLVLYFFCSSAVVEESSIAVFILSIVHQIILSSEEVRRVLIASTFLRGVLSDILKNLPPGQSLQFPGPNSHIRNLLGASPNSLWTALWAIMPFEQNPELAICISGIEHVRNNRIEFIRKIRQFVDDLQRTSKVKILLTSGLDKDTAQEFDGLPYIEYDKERTECLSSLFFLNTRLDKIAKASEDTFEWLWEHPQYKRWSDPQVSSILLIEGKPGSGKSTLTKYFNEHILERQPAANSAIVSRFFYSYRDGNPQRSHYNMLRSIIYDILQQDLGFFYHIQHEYRLQCHRQSVVEWSYGSLKQILSSLTNYSLPRPLCLVIDAVDESEQEDRRQILKLLFELGAKASQGIVKIFIASQPVDELEVRGKNVDNIIQLQAETASDISRFTRSMLEDLNFSLLLAKATEYIVDNAHGVFLWVKLVGSELELSIESGESEDAIFEHLEQLPTELDDFYQLMFMRLNSRPYTPDSMTMFQSVFWAATPFTVDELLHVVGISNTPDIEHTPTDNVFERRIPAKGRITSCGGNFLEVKRSNGKDIVQIMHQTARSNIDDAAVPFIEERDTSEDFTALLRAAEQGHEAVAKVLLTRNDINLNQKDEYGRTALAVAAEKGHRAVAELLLARSDIAADTRDKRHRTPLSLAAEQGHAAVIELFISRRDINADARDLFALTPLSHAAKRGHDAVMKLLLTRQDVKADSRDRLGLSPLLYAAERGHHDVVKLLLDREDVTADSKDDWGWTPLLRAASRGHHDVVKVLISCKDIKADFKHSFSGQTPLSLAAQHGHLAVAELLLAFKDVEADSKDIKGWTPLSWAARQGHQAIVELLILRKDVKVDRKDVYGRTPISWAAARGHRDIVELLRPLSDDRTDSNS
ncbi:hypothetical protein TsFJ059_005838 [Trichoderma semiorbis]|uniref:Nephrocystin 3-like N-terminal domain-containing protein n=1 Tax=Trichoderma semiorbis TaxID=1491008 RepID=A0A9P8H998_9HYPO|nr:hypothetical protein TsFJ059_005838 [Trichoderma semiorbis]